jgi:hypothetical protein
MRFVSSGWQSTLRCTALIAVAVTMMACDSSTGTLPQLISITGGNNQTVAEGTAAAVPLTVKATDVNGNPLNAAAVTFSIIAADGSILNSTATTTNSSGIATFTFTAGTTGGAVSVVASLAGESTITFTENVS